MPEMEFFAEERKRIASCLRRNAPALISALLSGIVSYGFIMFNILNSWDSIETSFGGFGSGIELGRWFLELLGRFAERVWGAVSVPAFNAALAVLLLSVSAAVLVSALGIKDRVLAAVSASVFMTFPTVGATMIYSFTVHYYAFAVLLAVSGVYMAVKTRYGVFSGAVLFALSMGIYQAYLPLAASLLVLCLIRQSICGEDGGRSSCRDLLKNSALYLSALALGVVIYFILLAVFLKIYGASLSDYQGVGGMGFDLAAIPSAVAKAYKNIFAMTVSPVYGVSDTVFIRAMIAISLFLTAALSAFFLIFVKAPALRKAYLALLAAVLPLAAGSIVIMSPKAYVHLLMVYGCAAVFLAPAVIFESVASCRDRIKLRMSAGALKKSASASFAAVVLTSALSSVNYAWQTNGTYMLLHYTDEQTTEYFSSLITRIRSTEGYRDDLPLAIVGDTISDGAYFNFAYADSPFRYTGIDENFLNIYSRDRWLLYYFGFAQPFADADTLAALSSSARVASMPQYPDDGSIAVIDGVIVLKLSEKETPSG